MESSRERQNSAFAINTSVASGLTIKHGVRSRVVTAASFELAYDYCVHTMLCGGQRVAEYGGLEVRPVSLRQQVLSLAASIGGPDVLGDLLVGEERRAPRMIELVVDSGTDQYRIGTYTQQRLSVHTGYGTMVRCGHDIRGKVPAEEPADRIPAIGFRVPGHQVPKPGRIGAGDFSHDAGVV